MSQHVNSHKLVSDKKRWKVHFAPAVTKVATTSIFSERPTEDNILEEASTSSETTDS